MRRMYVSSVIYVVFVDIYIFFFCCSTNAYLYYYRQTYTVNNNYYKYTTPRNCSIDRTAMTNNALCVARCFVLENRWPLALAFGSIVLGYSIGHYFDGTLNSSGTDISTSVTAQLPVEFWQGIQTKIDDIAAEIQELQTSLSRAFRTQNTNSKR